MMLDMCRQSTLDMAEKRIFSDFLVWNFMVAENTSRIREIAAVHQTESTKIRGNFRQEKANSVDYVMKRTIRNGTYLLCLHLKRVSAQERYPPRQHGSRARE